MLVNIKIKISLTHYEVPNDWTGGLYCVFKLDWNYIDHTLYIYMPGYITSLLTKYKHSKPNKLQQSPYPTAPRQYGKDYQKPLPEDTTNQSSYDEIKHIQQAVGSIFYYARTVDLTVLMALSTIASEQTRATQKALTNLNQLLDYLASRPNAKIRYHASDMILNIHSDASYLADSSARSRASGHYFLGWLPQKNDPIQLNGSIFTFAVCCIICSRS